MNDTVLSPEQVELVSFCMKNGMIATAHRFDRKLIKETCSRVHFDFDKWHKDVMQITGNNNII